MTFNNAAAQLRFTPRPSSAMEEPPRYRRKLPAKPCRRCGRKHLRTHLHLGVCVQCRVEAGE